MQELDDNALLREYVGRDSEEAFATLVTRHINKVYSVAWRHTGNLHQAEEITQAVFVMLARKSAHLGKRVILEGWLYQTARLTSLTFIRSEIRRAHREQEAYVQIVSNQNDSEAWTQIAPLLDAALAGLNETDRHAVVLRFFYGKSMKEIGVACGGSEGATRIRLHRAVEKLRNFFVKCGITSTPEIIVRAISTHSVQTAPATLANTVTAAALAQGATGGGSTLTLVKGALKVMAWTKAKTAIVVGAAIILAGGTTTYLVKGIGPHRNLASLIAKHPLLTSKQVESYLKEHGRSAANLLAGFRTSDDAGFLKEAMQKFPNEPEVDFEAACDSKLSPQEQRQLLDVFKKSAPDNALPNYLSALNYFNSGQQERAMQEITVASAKPLEDYSLIRVQNDVEPYRSAGYSTVESKMLSVYLVSPPQVAALKQLGQRVIAVAKTYRESGNGAVAEDAFRMAAELGEQYASPSPGEPLVSQLVGIKIDQTALEAMDPNKPFGSSGHTVQEQLAQLGQQETDFRKLSKQCLPLIAQMSDQDWMKVLDHYMASGEASAMQWLISQHGNR